MKALTKILTSLALAAAGVFPAAAFGVSAGEVLLETALAAVFEGLVLYAGTAIGLGAAFAGSETGEIIGAVVISTYPLAASFGAFAAGEGAYGLSENAGAAFGYTTLAAYGQLGAFIGVAAAFDLSSGEEQDDFYEEAVAADALTKPFVVTIVYNIVKKPAGRAEASRGPTLEPYVSVTRGGGPVAMYGVTFGF